MGIKLDIIGIANPIKIEKKRAEGVG